MVREPIPDDREITALRPTQITVGMREVMAKRQRGARPGRRRAERFSAST